MQFLQFLEKLAGHRGWVQIARPSRLKFFHQLAQNHFHDRQQDAKLDRGCLHPGRAGDGHRPGRQVDFFYSRLLDDLTASFNMFAKHVIGIVIDKINLCAHFHTLPGGADHKRSFTSFGNSKDHVFSGNPQLANLFFAKGSEVLEAFDRFDESKIAPRHHAESTILEFFKGWRRLRST